MGAVKVGNYTFYGPYSPNGTFPDTAGIYAPMTMTALGEYRLLDVGETQSFADRLPQHERALCWRGYANGSYAVWLLEMKNSTGEQRRQVERYIRTNWNPPCGER